MDRLKGALYLKRILNIYKNGGDISIDKLPIDNVQIYKGLEYLIEEDAMSMYELAFLSRFSKICESRLYSKSEHITDEEILCVTNRDYILSEIKIIETLISNEDERLQSLLELITSNRTKLSRREVEYNKDILQLIPYMMVEYQDDLILLEKKKGDCRLINTIDLPAGHCSEDNITDSIFKELKEELNINKDDVSKMKLLKCIPPTNDSLNVSYYHLGLLIIVTLEDNVDIKNNEEDKSDLILLSDIEKHPSKIKNIGDWAGYGILEYFKIKNI